MKPLQPIGVPAPGVSIPNAPDNEISLVDVAMTVWLHRRAAMTTFGAVLACGLAAAWALPEKYSYVTTIEIGQRSEDGKTVPIESTETTLAKLQDSYLPAAQRRYLQNHRDDGVFEVIARVPKNSQLVALGSTSPEASSAPYRQIQEQAARDLLADHARVFDSQRMEIKLQKQRTEAALQALVDEAKTLVRQVDRLKQTDQLLVQQIADTRALIDVASKNRSHAIGEARDEARAMTLLMLENEMRANRVHLADLQQRLQIGQQEQRDTLQDRLRKNDRDQALRRAEMQRLDLQLTNLQETRALGLAVQSPRPVGGSRSLIVALSLMLGCMLAVLVPLGLAFVDGVRQRLHGASAYRAAGRMGSLTPAD